MAGITFEQLYEYEVGQVFNVDKFLQGTSGWAYPYELVVIVKKTQKRVYMKKVGLFNGKHLPYGGRFCVEGRSPAQPFHITPIIPSARFHAIQSLQYLAERLRQLL